MAKQLNYSYLPRQGDFLQACDKHQHAAYIGGFGSGKTHILVVQILREATRARSFGLVGAPTYRLLSDTTMRKFFELCPKQWIVNFAKSDYRVDLINGTEIIFRSLDMPERLTNLGLDWFAIDELGEIKLDTFRMLQGRLRNPGGSHHGFGVGNPAGPVHWTYEYFVLKAQDYPDTYNLTQATTYENTFVDKSYAIGLEKSYGVGTLYYRRFVLGEFVAFEGAYWPNFDIRPYASGGMVLTIDEIPKVLNPNKKWVYGRVLDFGFEHPFCLLWWVHDGTTMVFYDEYHKRHTSIREHLEAIRKHEKEHQKWFGAFSYSATWTDHDAQARYEIENCKDLSGRFIGFTCSPSEKTVMDSILLVQALVERNGLYITEQCKQSRIEIPSYRAKPNVAQEAPIKEDDDTCDCVRMACWMEMPHMKQFVRSFSHNIIPDNLEEIGPTALEELPRVAPVDAFADTL